MKFDFLGHLLGPARRRELAGRAAVNLTLLSQRIGFGLTAAAAVATARPELLTSHSGLGVLGLTLLAAAFPVGKGNTGLVNPTAPNAPSVLQAVVQGVSTLLAAPAEKRQAVFQQQVAAGIQSQMPTILTLAAQELNKTNEFNKTNMTGFSASELGGQVPVDLKPSGDGATASLAANAGLSAITSVSPLTPETTTDSDRAILETGGNQ